MRNILNTSVAPVKSAVHFKSQIFENIKRSKPLAIDKPPMPTAEEKKASLALIKAQAQGLVESSLLIAPSSNTGGQNGKPVFAVDFVVCTDGLSFTFKQQLVSSNNDDMVKIMERLMRDAMGYQLLEVRARASGNNGYEYSAQVVVPVDKGREPNVGIMAWGGESQKGTVYVSLMGAGCELISSMQHFADTFIALDAVLTRVDTAIDDYDGVFTLDDVKQWYAAGVMATSSAWPKYKYISDENEYCNSGMSFGGSTIYVGKKENGKEMCMYEKGKAMGDAFSNWLRFEVRLYKKDRILPWDMIVNPTNYVRGFCPAFDAAFSVVSLITDRIKTIKKKLDTSLQHLVYHMQRSYGAVLNLLSRDLHHKSVLHGADLSVEQVSHKVLLAVQVMKTPKRVGVLAEAIFGLVSPYGNYSQEIPF